MERIALGETFSKLKVKKDEVPGGDIGVEKVVVPEVNYEQYPSTGVPPTMIGSMNVLPYMYMTSGVSVPTITVSGGDASVVVNYRQESGKLIRETTYIDAAGNVNTVIETLGPP